MICDRCGGEAHAAALEDVRPHGLRLVTTCRGCGVATISTEPSNTEVIVTGLLAARAR